MEGDWGRGRNLREVDLPQSRGLRSRGIVVGTRLGWQEIHIQKESSTGIHINVQLPIFILAAKEWLELLILNNQNYLPMNFSSPTHQKRVSSTKNLTNNCLFFVPEQTRRLTVDCQTSSIAVFRDSQREQASKSKLEECYPGHQMIFKNQII